MKLTYTASLVLLLVSILLTACSAATPTPVDVNAMMTAGVGTMVASFFGTQTAMVTPATATPLATLTPFPTNTFLPTSIWPVPATPTQYIIYNTPTLAFVTPLTPLATGTQPTATIDPGSVGVGCNNLAFIRDVTVPAGTKFSPKQDFVKTWKVQNNGTGPWMYQYRLVVLSGSDFDAGDTKIQKKVEVNDWTELSVNLSAPKIAGTYTSYWRLADADGNMFGSTLTVSFIVE
jgi:hypothetical protein